MSAALRRRHTPEDIWQEALLHAWRDRARCEWRGLKSFRSWLMSIIDNRIRDAAAHEGAAKRGGGSTPVPFSAIEQSGSQGDRESNFPGPVASTTPSRIAVFREQADAMREALRSLPAEMREVVRLRLFEQLAMTAIAERLEIGLSAARHRFRKGAQIYQRQLVSALASRSQAAAGESARSVDANPSPDK